jgi:GNAT superfamily N-acetyltransferase
VIRRASPADLPRIVELLSRANDAPYDLTRVAEEKCFGAGFDGQPEVNIFGDFQGISVTCGDYLRILAVAREFRNRGIGDALLENSSVSVLAAEPGNYFTPGIVESDTATLAFFRKRGFRESARTQNLITETLPESVPAGVQRAHDRELVLEFIEREFGSIWRFEASRGRAIFYAADAGEIVGFSTHDANNRGLGFFGPTGVAESMRGKGIGRHLLLASMADLRKSGYTRVVIPWTDSIDFYRKTCGARVEHRFVIMRRIAS